MWNTAIHEQDGTAYDSVSTGYWSQRERRGKVKAFNQFRDARFKTEPSAASFDKILPAIKKLSIPEETCEGQRQETLLLNPQVEIEFLESLEEFGIKEAIAIARLAGFEYTAYRLGEILSFQKELESDEQPLSSFSLKQFLLFLMGHIGLREPSIVVTDRGNVKAIWECSEKQIFWIEFYPSGDVRYLAFVPNERRSDGIERTAGWSTASDVFDRANNLGATVWMIS
ncbi:MAG: hypothetical protein FJ128_12835 [Deltaproteobacteria bacterium]|nr:hypothetical protein [Deltaproteobacteria bacterium]MBM4286110.1 hypothetical protein [Deltaproteobacteria bacterium]